MTSTLTHMSQLYEISFNFPARDSQTCLIQSKPKVQSRSMARLPLIVNALLAVHQTTG